MASKEVGWPVCKVACYGPEGGIVPHMLKTLLSALCVCVMAGCVTAPSVEVQGDAKIDQQSASATAGTIAVRVVNPNNRPIRLVEYDYTVQAGGGSTWRGRHDGGMVLSPGFDRIAELPIVLPVGTASGTRIHVGGSLHYLDTSTFAQTLADWGYRPTSDFSGSGTVAEQAQAGPEAP